MQQVRKSVAQIRREGWVYRESTYLDSVVNQRYGAIYPHALVTFRSGIRAALLASRLESLLHCLMFPTACGRRFIPAVADALAPLSKSRDPQSDVPTKVWPLHGRCTLSPLEHKEFTTRGRHSNIVLALATRHVHRKHLVMLNGSITFALLVLWESAATWPVLQGCSVLVITLRKSPPMARWQMDVNLLNSRLTLHNVQLCSGTSCCGGRRATCSRVSR